MIGSKILLVVLVIAISDNVVGQFTQNSPANSMTAAQQAKLMSMIRARNTPQQQTGKIFHAMRDIKLGVGINLGVV